MATVYLETTIPSYLTSRPSRDLIVAAHQQITHEWWEQDKESFELFISEAVLDEIRQGDSQYANRRMELVQDIPVLALTEEVDSLARAYYRQLGLPPKAQADALHIAFGVAYNMDYLLTWNCKHIANGFVIQRLLKINDESQRHVPIIVTPEELLEGIGGRET